MIVTCPACATGHEVPVDAPAFAGGLLRCPACGHRWLNTAASSTVENTVTLLPRHEAQVIDMPEPPHHEGVDAPGEAEAEAEERARRAAEALARQALAREKARRRKAARRRAERIRWSALAAMLAAISFVAWRYPGQVVRLLPGAAHAYALAGIDVRAAGIDIREVDTAQTLAPDGRLVLSVSGRIANISVRDVRAPGLEFRLLDGKGRVVHSWKLPATTGKVLPAGRTASFMTRIAQPPQDARKVEVRLLKRT